MPRDAVDPTEQFRRGHERQQDASRRLKERVERLSRECVKGTTLFREHPELREPDVFVTVTAQHVHINSSLNRGQLEILPLTGRTAALMQFGEELRVGFERIAADLHLPIVTEPGGPFGQSQLIFIVDVPSGYQAVLKRQDP